MSFQVIFYSLSTVQISIKKKNLDFKFLFYFRILTVSIPLLISVPLAFVGNGYWAIVIGQILVSAASTLTFWIILIGNQLSILI
jgi:PST family polysaccharide transporter